MIVFPAGEGSIHCKAWIREKDGLDPTACNQINDLQRLPFAFHHIAIMPDVHGGYGMPIGGVLATNGVVVPNAVGVDIGCGMRAMKTTLTGITTDQLKKVMGEIRSSIPVGFEHHEEDKASPLFDNPPDIQVIREQLASARKQIGTLGGGNHFIEIQKGDDGHIWAMVHSGSRNFGYKIAKYYNEQAQKLCRRWYSAIPPFKGEDGLAFLPIEDPLAKEYMKAMNYALDFAKENRRHMMVDIRRAFGFALYDHVWPWSEPLEEIDIHHNYAAWENHFGKDVIVHRKGATSAKKGEIGIIPGSQGTASYIVMGKGNPDSFMSCSHGAGRKMSRGEARKRLVLADEQERLNSKGILHAVRGVDDLDEAAGAYKDIDEVMAEQTDLVDVFVKLVPLGVIKG